METLDHLYAGYHGRYDMLSVEDVKFLIRCGIDPVGDTVESQPRLPRESQEEA